MGLQTRINRFETIWIELVELHSRAEDLPDNLINELEELSIRIFNETHGKIIPSIKEGDSQKEILLKLARSFASIKYGGGENRYWNMLSVARDWAELSDKYQEDVKVFDELFSLPNFEPDAFMARRFELEGVYVSDATRLNEIVKRRFDEAINCYIYGNYLGGLAMCRAILEIAFVDMYKDECPTYFLQRKNKIEVKLGAFIHDKWGDFFTPGDEELRDNLVQKAVNIHTAAGTILHSYNEMWVELLCYSGQLRDQLANLKAILEYLYSK
ncbi:MAG: hypothetical protein IH823_07395 [Candidatus Dadabacteria bacterium]|nr:hypothetical protein [Candidatus Dadabacteria bacterium]